MATTTNKEGYTLTEERFQELSQWTFECDKVFECVILERYNLTRAKYESDEQWFNSEKSDLHLSVAYFEIGWFRQAASTSDYFLKKSEEECKRLRAELDELKTQLIYAQVSAETYQKEYKKVFEREFELMCENGRLKNELNDIRAQEDGKVI